MQFTVLINQSKALEWGLNAQQAMLFAIVHNAPTWAETVVVEGKVFYKLSKAKIISELPLLTDKPDTAYRLLKALELVEVIELSSTSVITLVRLTEKGKTWNTSEKYPSKVGKKSDLRSEKNPTDQVTSNQVTSDTSKTLVEQARPEREKIPFEKIMDLYREVCVPTFKGASTLTKARKKNIETCWSYKVKGKKHFQSAEFWRVFFNRCLLNPHWCGANGPWRASLEFLTRMDVMERVVDEILVDMESEHDAA